MFKTNFTFSLVVLPLLILIGCAPPSNRANEFEELSVSSSGYYAADPQRDKNKPSDPLRDQIGSLFLVEQFNAKVFDSMKKAIKEHPPAGIVYWNPEGANANDLYQINYEYSKTAADAQKLPLLFSTDYEGGGLSTTTSGKTVPGIQRFTKGFTKLAHPAWLGKSMAKYGTKLCHLHGEIMAKELMAVGINYPLATVSDLSLGLFYNRGISRDSRNISDCMNEMITAFHSVKGMTFVTKHFPGLGETQGDTHDGTVVSKAKSMTDLDKSLAPYISSINFVNQMGFDNSYSILASHAKFDVLDKDNITTVSKPILTDFLRDQLNFKGVVLSDAMWMGDYGHYQTPELLVVYLKSVLSGMDVLMISGKTFAASVRFFRAIYDDTLPENQKNQIANTLQTDWKSLRHHFITRLKQSADRVNALKNSTSFYVNGMAKADFVDAQESTKVQTTEYYKILSDLGLPL